MKGATEAVRVLIVEDSEKWRAFLCAAVRDAKMVVVGEATDGLQSIQYTRLLHPDLILLDIGLPGLSGIEAAREIRKVYPQSKIVFVTQESDQEVREAAMSTGACGFVLKSQAVTELPLAIEAALAEDMFKFPSAADIG